MNSKTHTIKIKASRPTALALSLSLVLLSAGTGECVYAQDATAYNTSNAGYQTPFMALEVEEDVLPPEVVPVDPSTVATRSAAPTETAAASAASASGNVPGLVDSQATGMTANNAGDDDGYQSIKEFRQSAMEHLAQQGQSGQGGQQMWRAGQMNDSGNADGSVPGMIPTDPVQQMQAVQAMQAPQNLGNPYDPNQAPGMNGYPGDQMAMGGQQSTPYQSQTLSGGTKQKARSRDIRRTGFSNVLSGAATLGAGALLYGALWRPQNMMTGLGIFGLSMTGFGTRNGFRW